MAELTVQDIYEIASSFLYEYDGDDEDSRSFSIHFLNVLLEETLNCENSIREHKGKERLEEAPYVRALTDVIDYSPSLTRTALPYGLAAQFFQENMDNFQAENYRAKYLAAVQDAGKMNDGIVEKGYGV